MTIEAAQKQRPEYGAAAIQVLEGLEAVRKRPGMYIGSTGERGLHHLVWEVVDNAVDEAMAGCARTATVRLLADGGVEVSDDGRGIPVDMHATGLPTVDVVMTVLHAGSKFEQGAYTVSGGLHGVGVSVVNALSTRVEVDIRRDGHEWFQIYERSVPGTLKRGRKTKATGTTVRFWADPGIFETISYDFDTVERRLQEIAFLNQGLTIELADERGPEPTISRRTFCYPGGVVDYVKHLHGSEPIHPSVITFRGNQPGQEVEIAMQWNVGDTDCLNNYANTINTHDGGTHADGFRAALTSVVNKYARDKKLLKGKDPVPTGDDIRRG